MALILDNVTGRGSFDFIDASGVIITGIRAIVIGDFGTAIDFSDRYNPRWHTFGHLSLLYADSMVWWQSWLNFEDQYFETFYDPTTVTQAAEQMGEPDAWSNPGTTEIQVTFRWAMRESTLLTVYIAS